MKLPTTSWLVPIVFSALAIAKGACGAIDVSDDERLARWIALHKKVECVNLELQTIGQPLIAKEGGPSLQRIDQSFKFRWPDGMLLEERTFRQRSRGTIDSAIASNDWEQSLFFSRAFQTDATVQARVIGDEINQTTKASAPRLFAEEAWQYSEVSPWVAARLLGEEPADAVSLTSTDSFVQVLVKHASQRFTFERDERFGLRLVRIEKFEGGALSEIFEYQEFGTFDNALSNPKRRINSRRLEYFDTKTRKIRSDESPSRQSETLLVSWTVPERLPDSAFILQTDSLTNVLAPSPSTPKGLAERSRNPVDNSAHSPGRKFDLTLSGAMRFGWIAGLAGAVAISIALLLRFRRG